MRPPTSPNSKAIIGASAHEHIDRVVVVIDYGSTERLPQCFTGFGPKKIGAYRADSGVALAVAWWMVYPVPLYDAIFALISVVRSNSPGSAKRILLSIIRICSPNIKSGLARNCSLDRFLT
jgi:hypothetical protein